MDPLFAHFPLNNQGKRKVESITESFQTLLEVLGEECGPTPDPRCFELVRTHLEAAAMYARKSMAMQKDNQQ